jgi:hypothetical protein
MNLMQLKRRLNKVLAKPNPVQVVKPNFLGIGAAKAGTTTIARILTTHPEISFPKDGRKEVHFFDYPEKIVDPRKDWYFSLFEPNKAVGEFTPSYLFVPECRDLIYETLGPNVKFIVTLRNPIDRAFSHYCHAVNNWHGEHYLKAGYPVETLSFKEAIAQEETRLQSGQYHIRHLSYFSKGLYAQQLKWYFEKFARENFYIFLLEDYAKNPETILREIYQFLAVDDKFQSPQVGIKINSQTNQPIPHDTRSILAQRYEGSISELEHLLDRDLSIWRA